MTTQANDGSPGGTAPAVPAGGLSELPLHQLPSHDVQGFVEELAKAHDIVDPRSTGLDAFADVVTRLSGDEVRSDATSLLLIALKRQEIISGSQLARLLANHLRERENVRSVRGLRDRRLSA